MAQPFPRSPRPAVFCFRLIPPGSTLTGRRPMSWPTTWTFSSLSGEKPCWMWPTWGMWDAISSGGGTSTRSHGTVGPTDKTPSQLFRPFPGYGNIDISEYAATSNYNALQVLVARRFTRGLVFSGAWTFSKAMDYADDE